MGIDYRKIKDCLAEEGRNVHDIFEYDCSENHEIMVVLMDLEAETLSESRSFYALSIYMGFGSRCY